MKRIAIGIWLGLLGAGGAYAAEKAREPQESAAQADDGLFAGGELVMAVNRYALYLMVADIEKGAKPAPELAAARAELDHACIKVAARAECTALDRSIRKEPDRFMAWTGEGFPAGK